MRVLVADKFDAAGIEAMTVAGATVLCEPAAGASGLGVALARHAPEVLIVRSSTVAAEAIRSAPRLRGIVRAGAGVDNIDLDAATAAGVLVSNCPGMNAASVAELVLGLMIACDRRIVDQTSELRAGRWNKKEYGTRARGLKGSTLGVVGPGAIGQEVIRRAKAFEMDIVGWTPFWTAADAQRLGVRFGGTDRPALLRMLPQCDAITVHVPLSPQTRHLCNAEFFAAMKPGATFINTSRGGVVDEGALRQAAAAKGLRCGLDVYENQPSTSQAEWATLTTALPGSAFTHHCGAGTAEAQRAVAIEAARQVAEFMRNGRLPNCVNPQAKAPATPAAQPV
jgi:D-3-phosphoglycerate dehydrogenase